MAAALVEAERLTTETAARKAAKQAEMEAGEATFRAVQVLGATLIADAAQDRATACRRLLGSDLVAESVVTLVARSQGSWRGTAAALLAEINVPLNPVHLGRRLRRLARLLRSVGVAVHMVKGGNIGRVIAIRSIDDRAMEMARQLSAR
jgi:hypothetical protein